MYIYNIKFDFIRFDIANVLYLFLWKLWIFLFSTVLTGNKGT